jgi:hypothetical protein
VCKPRYQILSRSLPVRYAAIAAPMSGQCLSWHAWARRGTNPVEKGRFSASGPQPPKPDRKKTYPPRLAVSALCPAASGPFTSLVPRRSIGASALPPQLARKRRQLTLLDAPSQGSV